MKESASAETGVLLVGVGGTGCELAAACHVAKARRRLVDFTSVDLDAYDPAETIPLDGDADDTDDMDPDLVREAAEEAAGILADTVGRGGELVLLVGAVGGQTGATVLPVIAGELRSAQATVLVIAIEPLPFEGPTRADMAARALAELELAADLLLTVPNRPLSDLFDASLPVDQAIDRLKEKIAGAVGQLLAALADGSCVGLQRSELRRALTEAGRGAFGTGVGRGEKRVEEAIRDACANSFLTQESCQNASAAILHLCGGGDLTLQEVSSATDMVAHLVGRVPVQAGLSTNATVDEVRATLIVTGIQSLELDGAGSQAAPARGPFEDLNFYDGENLDVPAFVRRQSFARLGR